MDTPTPSSGREPLPLGRLAWAGLLLTVAFAGAALAAPCARDDCRNAPRELKSPHVPLQGPTVRIVELRDVDAAEDPSAAALSDSMAPLLYLTPRVTSILEEVFDDPVPPANADPETAPEPPVAKAEPSPEGDPERYGPLSQADNAQADDAFQVPKFQHQMYRTDI